MAFNEVRDEIGRNVAEALSTRALLGTCCLSMFIKRKANQQSVGSLRSDRFGVQDMLGNDDLTVTVADLLRGSTSRPIL